MARGFPSCGAGSQPHRGVCDLPGSEIDRVPCTGRWILNHGTAREVPRLKFSVSLADYQARDNKRLVYQPLILG